MRTSNPSYGLLESLSLSNLLGTRVTFQEAAGALSNPTLGIVEKVHSRYTTAKQPVEVVVARGEERKATHPSPQHKSTAPTEDFASFHSAQFTAKCHILISLQKAVLAQRPTLKGIDYRQYPRSILTEIDEKTSIKEEKPIPHTRKRSWQYS